MNWENNLEKNDQKIKLAKLGTEIAACEKKTRKRIIV